jgi:hypothetical protein
LCSFSLSSEFHFHFYSAFHSSWLLVSFQHEFADITGCIEVSGADEYQVWVRYEESS